MTSSLSDNVNKAATAAYAAGSIGTGVFSTVPSILLLYYCTETLLLAPAAVALLIFIPKVFSVFWDPFVGAWSDIFGSQAGRRRPFMLLGAFGTGTFFFAVFSPPDLSPLLLLIWVGTAYFLMNAFYSLFAVPYTGVPAEIAGHDKESVRLVGARMMLLMAGILIGGAAAPVMVAQFGGGRSGYSAMAVVISLSCLAAMLLATNMLKPFDTVRHHALRPPSLPSFLGRMHQVFQNRSYRYLLLAFISQAAAYGGISAALPYLITKVFSRSDDDVGLGLGLVIITSFITVPAWGWLATKIGYALSIGSSAIGYACAAGCLAWWGFSGGSWSIGLMLLSFAGFFFAGLQILPFSFAAEIVRLTAPNQEAGFAGIWVAIEKLGIASGAALFGLVLAFDTSPLAICAFVGIAPALLGMFSLPWLSLPAKWLPLKTE